MIHATRAAIGPMVEAFRPLRGVHVLNQLDEALLARIPSGSGVPDECVDRMTTQITLAIDAGSDIVLTTCNAYSAVVMGHIRERFRPVPVLVVDETMIRRAAKFERVAILATVAAGLRSQRELFGMIATELAAEPEVSVSLREDAFVRLQSGDAPGHDAIVLEEIDRLAQHVDVVVLAQVSMARVLPFVPPRLAPRVLSSPRAAVEEVARLLGLGDGARAAYHQ